MPNPRRPSYSNVSNANTIANNVDVLSPRTPRSISKSQRSSVVTEHVQDVIHESNTTRRASVVLNRPPLLSDRTNSYYQDMSAQDSDIVRSETPTLRARNISSNELAGHHSRSSSISSLLGLNTTGIPSFDVHTLYKIKTSRSSKKLDHFFGEFAPHDICVKEIRKEGLKAMLAAKTPLCYFLYHLLEEYSSENLFFFIELEQYESFNYVSVEQQLATAQHIFDTYLTSNSYFEVNLDDKVRRQTSSALEQKNAKSCFHDAKRAVFTLLESSYMRFQSTFVFNEMVKNCGELTTFYDETSRTAAVNQLVKYIEKEEATIYSNLDSFQNTKIRRHQLIKSMIHEFCRTFIGVEFDLDESSNKFRHVRFPSFGKEPTC